MVAPSRLERLSFSSQSLIPGIDRPIAAVRIFCVAQILMCLPTLVRIPVLAAGARDVPITINERCVMIIVASAIIVMLNRREARLDRVALLALLFVAIGGGSAIWSVHRFNLTPLQVIISLAFLA